MIRRVLYPAVVLAAKLFDQEVPVERLRELLLRGLDDFEKHSSDKADDREAAEIAQAKLLAAQAGLDLPKPSSQTASFHKDEPTKDEIDRWIASVPDGKVVTAKRLIAGTGCWLDQIESAGHEDHRDFVEQNLQSLLRHVEIRRKRCLGVIEPAKGTKDTWLEKHDVAILLARSARRRHDLRLLNTAMKLNDWAYPVYRKPPVASRYLLALAEQEKAVRELMQ